jgi:hypothetical protein
LIGKGLPNASSQTKAINRKSRQSDRLLGVEHFHPIVAASVFVPDGQKPIVALGFARLFQGDLMSAVHLLIPQLEPCLRHILRMNGHDPSVRRDDDTEEDLSLSGIFSRHAPELEQILGAPLSQEMERLYNRRPGPAIRNELAHGKMSASACYTPDAFYGCWLFYRVCCLFALGAWEACIEPTLSNIHGSEDV